MIGNNYQTDIGTIHQGFMSMNSEFANTKFYGTKGNGFGKDLTKKEKSITTVYLLGNDCEEMSKVERELICKGYIVRNPLRLISQKLDTSKKLREALKLIVECDSLYLCPHFSEDSSLELQYRVANTLDLKLLEFDGMDIEKEHKKTVTL